MRWTVSSWSMIDSPVSVQLASEALHLLVFDHVSHLGRLVSIESRSGRALVHFGHGGSSELICDGLNYRAARGILNILYLPRDRQLISNLDARLAADVQDQRITGDVGNQS